MDWMHFTPSPIHTVHVSPTSRFVTLTTTVPYYYHLTHVPYPNGVGCERLSLVCWVPRDLRIRPGLKPIDILPTGIRKIFLFGALLATRSICIKHGSVMSHLAFQMWLIRLPDFFVAL